MKKILLFTLFLLTINISSQIKQELITLTTKPTEITTLCSERPGSVRSVISGLTLNDIPDLGKPVSIGDYIYVRFVCYDANNNRIKNRRRKIKIQNEMTFINKFVWTSKMWNPVTKKYETPSGQIRVGIGFINDDDYLNPFKEITKVFNVCENDYDLDGIENSIDNCPNKFNLNQKDKDNDGLGDLCDSQDNSDSDGDGIQDWQDQCPYEAGPSSSNGCPGNADLVLDLDKSTSIASGCQCSTKPLYNKTPYTLYLSEHLGLNLRVNNTGKINSGNYKVGIYTSVTNDIKNATLMEEYNFNSISPSKFQTKHSIQLNHSDFNNTDGYGNTYLHIKVDNKNNVNEGNSGENNNIFSSIKLKIENRSRRGGKPIEIEFDLISIKDRFGRKIKNNIKTKNKDQEINLIKSLPSGLYLINKNGIKSKIYKKD